MDGDTTHQFRHDIIKPFFDQYLKAGAPDAHISPVTIYNTGENHWDRLPSWPPACEKGCAAPLKPLYLSGNYGLNFSAPTSVGSDSYVSDPAKPVSYLPVPVSFDQGDRWRTWLVTDQRFAANRPDVLTYETAPLTEPLRVSGAPVADLFAATTGTDADWVVKLIDVYPTNMPTNRKWAAINCPSLWISFADATVRALLNHPPSRRARRSATILRCPR